MDPIHCVVPGASWYLASERRTRIPLLPQLPPPPNGARERWPIDAGAPRKSHGRLRRTARTNPSTAFPPSLENRRNGRRFSTAPTDRRRSVACCRSLLSALPNGPNDLWSHGCGSDRLRSLPPSTFHATRDIPARIRRDLFTAQPRLPAEAQRARQGDGGQALRPGRTPVRGGRGPGEVFRPSLSVTTGLLIRPTLGITRFNEPLYIDGSQYTVTLNRRPACASDRQSPVRPEGAASLRLAAPRSQGRFPQKGSRL